jgi:hypothetical protein
MAQSSAGQEIPRLLWNAEFTTSPCPEPHESSPHSQIRLNRVPFHERLYLLRGLSYSGFPTEGLCISCLAISLDMAFSFACAAAACGLRAQRILNFCAFKVMCFLTTIHLYMPRQFHTP